ncbi:Protein of unknown function [Cotesia congregata]|uniref:Uncharacterized protein n=1 Tax=Cotesia congregata TaxID=51543 RepID=A0A8J2MEL0_COTCN|nr:Protein of unknown function [Cotesia congregata]
MDPLSCHSKLISPRKSKFKRKNFQDCPKKEKKTINQSDVKNNIHDEFETNPNLVQAENEHHGICAKRKDEEIKQRLLQVVNTEEVESQLFGNVELFLQQHQHRHSTTDIEVLK